VVRSFQVFPRLFDGMDHCGGSALKNRQGWGAISLTGTLFLALLTSGQSDPLVVILLCGGTWILIAYAFVAFGYIKIKHSIPEKMARVPLALFLSILFPLGWGWYEWPDESTALSLINADLLTYEKGKAPVLSVAVQNNGQALEVIGFVKVTIEDKFDTAHQKEHQEQLWKTFEDQNQDSSNPKKLLFPKKTPTGFLVTNPGVVLTEKQLSGGVVYYMASLQWETFWGKYEFEYCAYSGMRSDLIANCEGHNGPFRR
jgi:hypothetical protein